MLLVALAALPFHRPLLHDAPHVGVGDVVAGLALLACLVTTRLPRVAWVRLAVLLLTLSPSLLMADDRRRALLQLVGLAYVMLVSGAACSLAQRRWRDGLVAVIVGAALACALGAIFTERYPWMKWPRPVGPTESPAMLSMIALAGLFARRALGRESGRWRALDALFWITLVAAQSRILLVAIVGVAVTEWPRRRLLASSAIAVALALFVASLIWRIVPISISPLHVDTHRSPYAICHDVGWRAFASRPLTGVGLRGFQSAWSRYVDEKAAAEAFAPLLPTPRDPHGTLSGYAAEAGLPALVLLGFLAVDLWRRRRDGREVVGYLVALALASCTLDLLTERTSWALLGLFTASAARNDR